MGQRRGWRGGVERGQEVILEEPRHRLAGCFSEHLDAGQILVRRGMPELDEPCGQPELGRNAIDRAGVRAQLKWIDEAVDEPDDRSRVALPERQVGRGALARQRCVLQDGREECVRGLEGLWEGSYGLPRR